MFTAAFWAENWIKLLFGLLSTVIVAYGTYLHKKFKDYKNLTSERDDEAIEAMIEKRIQERIAPVQKELEVTRERFDVIKDSYKYRLIAVCQVYLDRGYLNSEEYHQLSEMWKVYHGLGGNSQAEDYYHKVESLPIHN